MNFSLLDAGGLAVSVLSYGVLLLLPGLALAALSGALGFKAASTGDKTGIGLVLGLALLPLLDSLAIRFAGLDSAIALALASSGAGLTLAWRGGWRLRPSAAALAPLAVWFVLLTVEWIDFDIGGKLYQPFIVMDMVKHAATAQAIRDSGAPPLDPFFLRPERVSYYYFFYTLPALSLRLCGGLADARAAVGGLAFWVGIGLYNLVRLVIRHAGFPGSNESRRSRLLLLALLATGGLDILFVTWRGWRDGTWLPDPEAWNEQVTNWFESILWVPHHVNGLIALFAGFLISVQCIEAPRRPAPGAILVAAGCFAAALGLSIWVTLAGLVTACVWFVLLFVERRWRAITTLAVVGMVALVLALPQIHDLQAGRSSGLPIALTIRAFMPVDDYVAPGILRMVLRLICLPLNYGEEFGILAVGTILFWMDHKRIRRQERFPVRWNHLTDEKSLFFQRAGAFSRSQKSTTFVENALASHAASDELARILTIGAITGLALGTFFHSLLFSNDLGWRVMLLPQLAALVWTIAVLEHRMSTAPRLPAFRAVPLLAGVPIALGLGTTFYAAVCLRAFYALPVTSTSPVPLAGRDTQHALRTAYAWADEALPRQTILQHNPNDLDHSQRALAFGLYSANRVAVGDLFGGLFGADFDRVAARLQAIQPIFKQSLSDSTVAAIARAAQIDALVVTADDPAWQAHAAWIWRTPPLYAAPRVRIVPVAAIGNAAVAALPAITQRVGALP